MSYTNSVVLSFSSYEFPAEEDDDFMEGCSPLKKINEWLERHDFDPLEDLADSLGGNVVLFGGAYNYLDVPKFCEFIQRQKWKEIENVRVIYWYDSDSRFTLVEFPLAWVVNRKKRTPKKIKKKPACAPKV